MTSIQKELFELQDKEYREFHAKLVPTIDKETIIGIRVPILRKFTKTYYKEHKAECNEFINQLPHKYFEENNFHAFILEEEKDIDVLFKKLDEFLPYVDNWATCDSLKPKVFKKNKETLENKCYEWMNSEDVYVIRFGIEQLMNYFLDEDFNLRQVKAIVKVKNDDYYVKMMVAWYFATALSKQWDEIIPFIEKKKLEPWTHNKAIQKAIESYRITSEQKEYLRSLKIKK